MGGLREAYDSVCLTVGLDVPRSHACALALVQGMHVGCSVHAECLMERSRGWAATLVLLFF